VVVRNESLQSDTQLLQVIDAISLLAFSFHASNRRKKERG
jgi:hypothetical protein